MVNDTDTKICSKCKRELPATTDFFYVESRGKHGLYSICKDCKSIYNKQRDKDPLVKERRRNTHRKCSLERNYGITDEEYNKMFEEQHGLCAVCGKPETRFEHKSGKVQRLSVDHNHVTSKIRGLLCDRCNKVIGMLEIDTVGGKLLLSIIQYLEKNNASC